MSIVHALVAFGQRILCESSVEGSKDFSHATAMILSKLPPNDSRLTYAADDYLFHYVKKDDVVFMCMAEESRGRKVPFTFLADMQRKFTTQYTRDDIANAPPYSLGGFAGTLAQAVETTNRTPPPPDPMRQAQEELASVKDIMVQNVEQILSRGERIELLVDKTDAMSAQASAFRKRSQALRRRMWWRNTKMMALSVAVVLVVVYLLIAQACGAGLNHCSS